MQAKTIHLLPRPQQIEITQESTFSLGGDVKVEAPEEWQSLTAIDRFLEETGSTKSESASAVITIEKVDAIAAAFNHDLPEYDNEAYSLQITPTVVNVKAVTATGVIRAMQTLTQLAEGWDGTPELECCNITDWPAFKLRGYMHDVGRSFISIAELKKHVDLLSRFKINTFHWHLTENQAWRFEVKAYPQLTSSESMTRFAGQYYTQAECKELEEYAYQRGVTVIPEIDMPGHAAAFERAMGHTMQSDAGVDELQVILEEVAATFPHAPYIHIGADETSITRANFLETMTAKIHSLGKKVVVWNPASGVSITKEKGIDMTQMWSSSGHVISGMPNIDCRYNYTNHFDVFADLVGIYKSSIYYAQQGTSDIAGFISAPWNDRKTPTEQDIVKQNNMYANVIASTERAWIGGGKQYIEVGGTTLPNSGEEYEEFADWERRFLFHKENSLSTAEIPYVKQTNVRWRISDAFPNSGNSSLSFPPETSTEEILPSEFTYNGTTYQSSPATGAGIYLRHTWGTVVPSFFSSPQLNTTAYAWTYIYSPEEQDAGALIEFQNYGRSENDKAPDAGNWDRKGSKIWLNGEEILPPVWGNTGVTINSEVDLLNENFSARTPSSIHLKSGWNKVLIKLPYVTADGVRLNKWMFTFVVTDAEGRKALDGLVYSPEQILDEAATDLMNALNDIKLARNSKVSDELGFYPLSCAEELDAVIAEIEATLHDSMTSEERAAQLARLNAAYATFQENIANAQLNMPTPSTDSEEYFYTISTPLRDNRYVASNGNNQNMTGVASANATSAAWKFVARGDGSFDIVNHDGTYISPDATDNTAIKSTTSLPSAGWNLLESNELGYFIIVSGTSQLNQTNSGKNYAIYNWGSGTQISDTGCKFRITAIPEREEEKEQWYCIELAYGSSSDTQNLITAGTTTVMNAENEYRQTVSWSPYYFHYPLRYGNDSSPKAWVRISGLSSGTARINALNGHVIMNNCAATRSQSDSPSTITQQTDGSYTIDHWHYYAPSDGTENPYIGSSSASSNRFTITEVSDTDLAAYDIYSVEIVGAEDASEVVYDARVECVNPANAGIAKVYNCGRFFIAKGTSVTSADFVAEVYNSQEAVVSLNDKVVRVTYGVGGSVLETIASAEQLLSLTGVGYPSATAEARTSLQAALDACKAAPDDDNLVTALNAAITAYYACQDVTLPQPGKAYTIANVRQDGSIRYLYSSNSVLLTSDLDVDPATLGPAAVFVLGNPCERNSHNNSTGGETNRFYLANGLTGDYLIWRGSSGGANNNTGFLQTFDADYCAMRFTSCNSTNDNSFGTMFLMGMRSDKSLAKDGSIIIKTDGGYEGWSDSKAWSANWTNAMRIVEVDYPTAPQLLPVEDNTIGYAASFSAPYRVIVPDGVEVWTASSIEESSVKMTKMEGLAAIPAATGVVLTSASGNDLELIPASTQTATAPSENMLLPTGPTDNEVAQGAYDLTLPAEGAVLSFCRLESAAAIGGNRSYLSGTSAAATLTPDFNTGSVAIDGIDSDETDAPAEYYNLQGIRIMNPRPGQLYIRRQGPKAERIFIR